MKDIREQGHGGANWGIDLAAIRFPSVSSCLTLTYYFAGPTLLAGIHFGMDNASHASITVNDVVAMNDLLLNDSRIKGARPVDAVVIGQVGIWEQSRASEFEKVLTLAKRMIGRDVKVDRIQEYFRSSDVEVHIAGGGFYTIKSNVDPALPVLRENRPWS